MPRGNDSTPDGFSARGARALSSGGPAASNPSPLGMGGGEGGSGGVPDGGGGGGGGDGDGGGGGGGGVVGGVINWALWPLWGTIDALKWAGGTVNEVAVAPVIRMASPWGLAGSMLTTVKAFTPQRARDLARVAGNLGLNAAGLARTPAGGELLRSTGRATGSLSVAASSPAGRQFLLESATGLVKLAEALDTPEAKNFIKQGAVVAARGMDALASRHSKIFVKVRLFATAVVVVVDPRIGFSSCRALATKLALCGRTSFSSLRKSNKGLDYRGRFLVAKKNVLIWHERVATA